MRLDIALMNGARGEGALDDDVGLFEAFRDVALLVLEAAGDVGRLAVELVELVQDRRVGQNRVVDLDRPRQHLVIDLDQLAGFRCDRFRGRGDGCYGVAGEQRLVARHHVAAHPAHVLDAQHDRALLDREIDDVARGDDGLYARQFFRLGGIDRFDARMRMRAAQNLAPDHAWHGGVGGELGAARDLVHAIRANGALADALVVGDEVHWVVSRNLLRAHFSRGFHHRADDLVIAGAPAEVAGEPEADFLLARVRVFLQQRVGGDQHARRADAAL